MDKLLSIGMATFDDFDGVFFTIQSLRMYHPICNSDQVEFIVLDGNPEKPHSKAIKHYLNSVKNSVYLEQKDTKSSFDKYKIVNSANGKYVLILDCHVLLEIDGIKNLLEYYEQNKDCKNLVQGPLWYDDLQNYSTHFNPEWRGHMYGTWATNKEEYLKGQPFEIPMQGMGLCSFEKSNWPGINTNFKGFGGEEGYIAEKFRRNGGKNICLPTLKWNHRFGRPNGVPYPLKLDDRIWNYFVGWLEITKDPDHQMIKDIYEHFKKDAKHIDKILEEAKKTIL